MLVRILSVRLSVSNGALSSVKRFEVVTSVPSRRLAPSSSSYAAVVALFPDKPHYVFFLACLSDLALYETRMRLHFGFFPIVRLLARRRAS